MREVHEAMLVFMGTDHAQRRLWPKLNHNQRHEMVETILQEEDD
jgi:hypothetical protein